MSSNLFQLLPSYDTVLVNEKTSLSLSARTLLQNPGRMGNAARSDVERNDVTLCMRFEDAA
jgi:hypothetical protein